MSGLAAGPTTVLRRRRAACRLGEGWRMTRRPLRRIARLRRMLRRGSDDETWWDVPLRARGWADEGPAAPPGSVPAQRRMADDAAAAASDRTTAPNAPAAFVFLGPGDDEAAGHPPDARVSGLTRRCPREGTSGSGQTPVLPAGPAAPGTGAAAESTPGPTASSTLPPPPRFLPALVQRGRGRARRTTYKIMQ